MNNMRESFEKWAKSVGMTLSKVGTDEEYTFHEERDMWETYQEAYNLQQATIDRLMLEYCPDEMSKEQVDNWAASQKRAPEEFQ